MKPSFPYGGQAVIEGVMIRGQSAVATACRLPNSEIRVRHDIPDSLVQRYRWLGIPFVRGTPALIDALRIGFRSLIYSVDLQAEGAGLKPVSPFTYVVTIAVALVVGIGVFVMAPAALLGHPKIHSFWMNVIEGLVRMALLTLYVGGISFLPEIRRVFQYHGAEHMVINAYEGGAAPGPEAAKAYHTVHRRCGSTFLMLVFVVAILVHAPAGWPEHWYVRMLSRLALLIPVAGVSYEIIRLAGRYKDSRLLTVLVSPGLLLQRLTTRPPTDDQLEVASTALQAVLAEDEARLKG